MSADSAIMNPEQKILALKSQRQLQVFNLDTKTKVQSHAMHQDVIFWRWISPMVLGIVTDTAVYHWNVESDAPPQKMFDRHASLAEHQIINYRASDDEKWMVLIGIASNTGEAPNAFRIRGSMQLYNRERGVSQPIEGHAASFAELRTQDAPVPYKLFTFAVRTATGAKLHIVEIDHAAENPVFAKKAVDVFFPAEAANDFPVAMQVSRRYGIVYLITKYGFIHLYDLETGACIYMNRVSGETVFVAAENKASNGLIAVNRKGQVLSVSVDENTIVPYILHTLNNTDLAFKLASRGGLPGADDLYLQQFHSLFSMGQYNDAIRVAANSPRGPAMMPRPGGAQPFYPPASPSPNFAMNVGARTFEPQKSKALRIVNPETHTELDLEQVRQKTSAAAAASATSTPKAAHSPAPSSHGTSAPGTPKSTGSSGAAPASASTPTCAKWPASPTTSATHPTGTMGNTPSTNWRYTAVVSKATPKRYASSPG